MGREGK